MAGVGDAENKGLWLKAVPTAEEALQALKEGDPASLLEFLEATKTLDAYNTIHDLGSAAEADRNTKMEADDCRDRVKKVRDIIIAVS